jgi:hypothetical protein
MQVRTGLRQQTCLSPGRGKWPATVRQSDADWLPLLDSQQRTAPSISRIRCRAMETAALPLGISLTLDQFDATVVVIVLARGVNVAPLSRSPT